MKKLLTALLLIGGLSMTAKADFLGGGNIRDKSYTLHFSSAMPTAATAGNWVLIDLSSTTSFPHKETGFVGIASARVIVDKAAATTATVKLGVVTRVNFSSGTVSWFYSSNQLNNVSNTSALMESNPFEAIYKLRVDDSVPDTTAGTTPYLLTSDITSNSTTYNSTTTLPSTISIGAADRAPQVGDIILNVAKSAAAATITVDLIYFTDRR